METKELIKENNSLRDQLSSENKKFYERLLVVVRTKSFFREEEVYEETLLAIVQDLLEAQAQGKNAEAYLGCDIYQLADEIVAATPRENIKRMAYFTLYWIGPYLLFSVVIPTIISLIFSPDHTAKISLAGFLSNTVFTSLAIWGLLKYISTSRQALNFFNQKFFIVWLKCLIPSVLVIGIYVLILYLTQNIWVWTVHF
ncbi:hypothetical protein [Lactococcus sp.]|uniref:hypothetical protein n=1 Tax=Lactococcus sp. TaxID=44273 RepID=UPI002FCB6F8F